MVTLARVVEFRQMHQLIPDHTDRRFLIKVFAIRFQLLINPLWPWF